MQLWEWSLISIPHSSFMLCICRAHVLHWSLFLVPGAVSSKSKSRRRVGNDPSDLQILLVCDFYSRRQFSESFFSITYESFQRFANTWGREVLYDFEHRHSTDVKVSGFSLSRVWCVQLWTTKTFSNRTQMKFPFDSFVCCLTCASLTAFKVFE